MSKPTVARKRSPEAAPTWTDREVIQLVRAVVTFRDASLTGRILNVIGMNDGAHQNLLPPTLWGRKYLGSSPFADLSFTFHDRVWKLLDEFEGQEAARAELKAAAATLDRLVLRRAREICVPLGTMEKARWQQQARRVAAR